MNRERVGSGGMQKRENFEDFCVLRKNRKDFPLTASEMSEQIIMPGDKGTYVPGGAAAIPKKSILKNRCAG